MIKVVQHDNEYRITFNYDYRIVNIVKEIAGRKWNPNEKYWSIPIENIGLLIAQFKGTDFEDMVTIYSNENINVNESLDSTIEIPEYDLSNTKTYVRNNRKLYEHQLDFLKFALHRQDYGNENGFLVCDTMGMGKSIEAINLALINKSRYKYKHCLILCCINMSKYNWMDEVKVHTNGEYEGYILGSRKYKRLEKINYNGSSKDKLDDLMNGFKYGNKDEGELPYFLILNIEAIRMKDKKKYPLSDRLIEMIKLGEINMVVIDEVHKNVSPQSSQGKQLLRIKKLTNTSCMWVPMTGTPIVNKPADLFLPLRLVNAHTQDSYWNWNKQFCVYGGFGMHEIIGSKNIKQLKYILQNNMIRRLKENVLDLPEKIQLVEYVENSTYQSKLYAQINSEIKNDKDSIIKMLNPLSKFLRLRQVNGAPELVDENCIVDSKYLSKNNRLNRLIELVDDIIANNEKVVVFSNWVEPLRTVYKFLNKKYSVAVFTGTLNEAERQQQKDKFVNDDTCKIILGTIGALGTSHTLTVANNIIFYDEPWTAADKLQAEDRCHRVGTTKSVNVYTLITKDTVDERVHNILYNKEMVSNFIVDNIDIHSNPELFDTLVN